MNKEEIIEYINAKRKPISHCVDLTKYFIGRHKTSPIYLTPTFEQEFNSSMYELNKLKEQNKKYKEVIDKAIKILDNYQNNLYSKSAREFLDDDIERSITTLKEVE